MKAIDASFSRIANPPGSGVGGEDAFVLQAAVEDGEGS
jgi:hypothetical protein